MPLCSYLYGLLVWLVSSSSRNDLHLLLLISVLSPPFLMTSWRVTCLLSCLRLALWLCNCSILTLNYRLCWALFYSTHVAWLDVEVVYTSVKATCGVSSFYHLNSANLFSYHFANLMSQMRFPEVMLSVLLRRRPSFRGKPLDKTPCSTSLLPCRQFLSLPPI